MSTRQTIIHVKQVAAYVRAELRHEQLVQQGRQADRNYPAQYIARAQPRIDKLTQIDALLEEARGIAATLQEWPAG